MPKDDCFTPCDTDALLNKDLVSSRANRDNPVKIDVKRVLRKQIEVSAPV
jgi:hypothetical protein